MSSDVNETPQARGEEQSEIPDSLSEIARESETMAHSIRSILRVLNAQSGGDSGDSDDTDDSGDGYDHMPCNYMPPPPNIKSNTPDTAKIDMNDISLLTDKDDGPKRSIVQTLRARAAGKCSNVQTRKRLISSLLPDNGTKLKSFGKKVFCGVHGRDGNIFMSACQDNNIRVYDTSIGDFKLLQKIRARDVGWSVLDVALNATGTHLVYSSWNEYLYQVHILGDGYKDEGYTLEQTALCLDPPGHHQFCIFSVKFSQDSSELLGGANDGCIYLYDRDSNQQSLSIDAHEADVNAVCFVDETTHIVASGGDDGLCKVWDRRSLRESNPKPVGILAGHRDGLTYLDPRGDGRYVISNSKDQSIKLWDIRRFSNSKEVEESRRVARMRNDHWDYRFERLPRHSRKDKNLPGDTSVMTYQGHSVLQTLIRCHFSPQFTTGQRYVYTGCASGRVVIYDMLTGEVVKVLSGHRGCVRDVSWHPYNPEIISSSWDTSIMKWEHKDGTEDEEEKEMNQCTDRRSKRQRK